MASNSELQAEVERLRAENENLRGQLAASGARRVAVPEHRFVLSEGNRAELETYGVTNINGRRMTREEVAAKLGADQRGVELGDKDPVDAGVPVRPVGNVPGVDFVYPSVYPGAIDPAVAGTPGINGPAAGSKAAPPAPGERNPRPAPDTK